MTQDIRETLAAIRSAMPALNRATEDAERLLREVGDHLKEIGLGFSARSEPIPIKDENATQYLEYARLHGQLRFVVRMVCNGTTERDSWESCDRETKLRTFAALPGLVGLIAARVGRMNEQAGRIEEITRATQDALEALQAAPPAAHATPV